MKYYFGLDVGHVHTNAVYVDAQNPAWKYEYMIPSTAYLRENGELFYAPESVRAMQEDVISATPGQWITYIKQYALSGQFAQVNYNGRKVNVKKVMGGIIKACLDGAIKQFAEQDKAIRSIGNEDELVITPTYPATEHYENYRQELKKIIASVKPECGARITLTDTIPEPVAASIAFLGLNGRPGNILLFDLGGGTFDCAAIDIEHKAQGGYEFHQLLQVISKPIGGRDYSELLAQKVSLDLSKLHPGQTEQIAALNAQYNFKTDIETLKHALSGVAPKAMLFDPLNPAQTLSVEKQEYVALTDSLTNETMQHLKNTFNRFIEKYPERKLSKIVAVGGGSNFDVIQQRLKAFAKENRAYFETDEVFRTFEMSFAVAHGAALYALESNLKQKTNHSYGIELDGKIQMLIDLEKDLPERANRLSFVANGNSMDIRIYAFDTFIPPSGEQVIDGGNFMCRYSFATVPGKVYSCECSVNEKNEFCVALHDENAHLLPRTGSFGRQE